MSEVGTIKKGGRNRFHGYDYARMEDLLVAVTPLMGKYGIVVIQNEVERNVVEGNRLACTYEFSIIHESGEYWPERPRYTGMSTARDSKGNWDDKSVAKCHTAARKYFLLGLFQVPAGDFDDPDEDASTEAPKSEERRVPGPTSQAAPSQAAPSQTKQAAQQQPAQDPSVPHRIILGAGGGVDKWVSEYIKAIGTAVSQEQLQQWEDLNDASLQTLSDKYLEKYENIASATQRRLQDLQAPKREAPANGMPLDTQEAMNWIASRLTSIDTLEAAQTFWNQAVEPNRARFDEVDWQLLMNEWERTERRLAPVDDAMDQENPQ